MAYRCGLVLAAVVGLPLLLPLLDVLPPGCVAGVGRGRTSAPARAHTLVLVAGTR
jgi:hypothetical protein